MMKNAMEIKTAVLAAFAGLGTFLAELLGGWDSALITLLWFMGIDFLLGLVVAAVFKKSKKTDSGALSSAASFKGLLKKGAVLLVVLIANRLDLMSGGGHAVRTLVILFFLGNEGLSILENLGLMGVQYPSALKRALEALQKKGEGTDTTAPMK